MTNSLVCVLQVSSFGQVATKVSGHTAPVRSIDWMSDSIHFQTNTDSHELHFWKLHKPERTPMYAEEIRAKALPEDSSWSTWTCSMGWHVLGILTTFQSTRPLPTQAPSSFLGILQVQSHNDRKCVYKGQCCA
jgi:hypothetical protein